MAAGRPDSFERFFVASGTGMAAFMDHVRDIAGADIRQFSGGAGNQIATVESGGRRVDCRRRCAGGVRPPGFGRNLVSARNDQASAYRSSRLLVAALGLFQHARALEICCRVRDHHGSADWQRGILAARMDRQIPHCDRGIQELQR